MPQTSDLPGSATAFWDWQLHGSCRGAESAVFFHPDGERGRARALREHRAKAICNECPVLAQCREHALSVGEVYGIWGGMGESERAAAQGGRARRIRPTREPRRLAS
ncbi:WhiB family transcriptional regulator [Corynebacterium kalidii]|jgi:WhiB family redox-sensing transcriptional regulator|uniref:Transcriptional regulator WhiB n=1 Tax=Corynebacterium kalidii TaxID=2931982 RepID=A0A9X1WGV4_9CORY|nr:WhiB family transcriptional regulator [Corynebacterium kalidii]MCJ7857918.1 WhiB family transcriptional regulator [Corynebacterium kalidii]